jgi:hypothetical protein
VIQDSDEDEDEDEDDEEEEEEEEEEDVRKSYARLQADRLAEGSNKKVRVLRKFKSLLVGTHSLHSSLIVNTNTEVTTNVRKTSGPCTQKGHGKSTTIPSSKVICAMYASEYLFLRLKVSNTLILYLGNSAKGMPIVSSRGETRLFASISQGGTRYFFRPHFLKDYRNWSTHGEIYLTKCNELDFEPVAAALPPQSKDSERLDESASQANLDGFAKPVPKWSKEGLLEHIVDLVVSDDQVSF